jgi:hypothetical protein
MANEPTNGDLLAAILQLRDATSAGFEHQDRRFDRLERRMGRLETRIEHVESRLSA